MKFYQENKHFVKLNGEKYNFNSDFRKFFTAIEISKNDDILPNDKIYAIGRLLFGEIDDITLYPQLVASYFDLYTEKNKSTSGQKCLDFTQDSDLIFSAFWQIYGIDLTTAELSVEKFFALFKGLPEGTKLSEVIKIRVMKIPKRDKNNGEYVDSLIKLKNEYKIKENTSDNEKNLKKQYNQFRNSFLSWVG